MDVNQKSARIKTYASQPFGQECFAIRLGCKLEAPNSDNQKIEQMALPNATRECDDRGPGPHANVVALTTTRDFSSVESGG